MTENENNIKIIETSGPKIDRAPEKKKSEDVYYIEKSISEIKKNETSRLNILNTEQKEKTFANAETQKNNNIGISSLFSMPSIFQFILPTSNIHD